MSASGPIVYLAAQFPKLSETFVYREVLSLRAAGLPVSTVSVRPSDDVLGDPQLEALRSAAIPVYGAGGAALLKDALRETLARPLASLNLLSWSLRLMAQPDLRGLSARLKVPVQAFASLALARRLRPQAPRLLHAHMAHVPATLAMFTARQLGIPFSFTGHAADLFRDRALLIPKLKRAAFVHCISHWHREWYQSLVPRPEADYPLVRCGVNPEEFPSPIPSPGPVRLLAVGRLVPKKGFDLLLEALATPEMLAQNWNLTLIGDGPEAAALQAIAATHPAAERIRLTGALPNHRVRAALAEADLFVLPCRVDPDGDRDGIPVVLMEAMAAGVVVLCGDLPAIRELIEDGSTGRLLPPGAPRPLAAAMAELCASPALRASFLQAAREKILAEFSLAVNTQRIVDNLTQRKLWPS